MKTPKRINSKRPSLWIDSTFTVVRIFYSSGHVEFYEKFTDKWLRSYFSKSNPKTAIKVLKTDHTFLGYL